MQEIKTRETYWTWHAKHKPSNHLQERQKDPKEDELHFFKYFDSLPAGLHIVRIIRLWIHSTFEIMWSSTSTSCFKNENSIDVNPHFASIHIMDYVDSKPPIVNVRNECCSSIVCKGSIVNHKHCGCSMWACAKDLHDAYTRSSIWNKSISFELPSSRRVSVALRSKTKLEKKYLTSLIEDMMKNTIHLSLFLDKFTCAI